MAERPNDDSAGETIVVRRNGRWGRIASYVALGILLVLIVAVAIVWTQRRSIATHYLKSELERRGVSASYHLDRVGLRTQEVSNLVIGDPKDRKSTRLNSSH